MAFRTDREFDSLGDAFEFVCGEWSPVPVALWDETSPDLVVPQDDGRFLFRGECGDFEKTVAGLHRQETGTFDDGRRLSDPDLTLLTQRLIPDLALRFANTDDYDLDEPSAYAVLQHYGLPTRILDFTARPDIAFKFAASRKAAVGRVAVMERAVAFGGTPVFDFRGHEWAQRAQRQWAFGVIPADGLIDLKSEAARSRLGIRWYQFPVSPAEGPFFDANYAELLRWTDDPSAGFLRFHITEFVEGHGKLSPDLTEWLLDRVPIAPYCYLLERFEIDHAAVKYRSAKDLPVYDKDAEKGHSRRYWSSAYPGCSSWDRGKQFSWRPVGQITSDPRTYHADQYSQRRNGPDAT
jgi:FRG domain